jgi:hypothetical protein
MARVLGRRNEVCSLLQEVISIFAAATLCFVLAEPDSLALTSPFSDFEIPSKDHIRKGHDWRYESDLAQDFATKSSIYYLTSAAMSLSDKWPRCRLRT